MQAAALTLAYVAQIALFGAAGTMFIRAHLDQQKLRQGDRSGPVSERLRRLRFFYRPQPASAEARALRGRIGRELAYGFLFLCLAPLAPALAALLLGPFA